MAGRASAAGARAALHFADGIEPVLVDRVNDRVLRDLQAVAQNLVAAGFGHELKAGRHSACVWAKRFAGDWHELKLRLNCCNVIGAARQLSTFLIGVFGV